MNGKLSILALTLLLVSLFMVQTVAEPTLTPDEVLDIAMADPEVNEWVNEMNAKSYEPEFIESDNLWIVYFVAEDGYTEYGLEVLIDDSTGTIIDKYWYATATEPVYYEEAVDEALIFIQTDAFYTEIVTEISTEQWWGYSYDGFVYLYGNSYYSENYTYANIALEYQIDVNDTYEFTLLFLQANFAWGSPTHTLDEITSIVMADESVQEFVEIYENYTMEAVLSYYSGAVVNDMYLPEDIPLGYSYTFHFNNYYDYYYVEDVKATLDQADAICYCGGWDYGWLMVMVDDATGNILHIAGTTTNQLTDQQVLDTVAQHPEFASWYATMDDFQVTAYFDGYDTWYVNIYSSISMDWGYANVNDTSGEITDYYIFIPIPATKTEAEIIDIFLSSSDMEYWLDNVLDFEVYAYYDGAGNWWVYAYDTIIYQNYAYANIEDTTGNISDLYSNIVEPPQMSLDDIYSYLDDQQFEDFLDKYPDALVMVHYNVYSYYYDYDEYDDYENGTEEPAYPISDTEANGQWYIYVYSPTIIEAYIYLVIDDTTGDIVDEYSNEPEQYPQLNAASVEAIITDSTEYQEFIENYDEMYRYIYYYQGMWYAWFEGRDADGSYFFFSVTVDDATQLIVEVNTSPYVWYATADMEAGAVFDGTTQNTNYQSGPKPEGVLLSKVLEEEETSPVVMLNSFILTATLGVLSTIAIIRRRKLLKS